jgi:hypothetical protein
MINIGICAVGNLDRKRRTKDGVPFVAASIYNTLKSSSMPISADLSFPRCKEKRSLSVGTKSVAVDLGSPA